MNMKIEATVTESNFKNILLKEINKLHKDLRATGVVGLERFVIVADLMESNPEWFADELTHATFEHFGLITPVK